MVTLAIALVLSSPSFDPPDFGDLMVKLEVGTFAEVRHAIRALGAWEHKPAVEGLARRLKDRDPRLVDMAAEALAKIKTPAALAALYEARHLGGMVAVGAKAVVYVRARPRTPFGIRVLGRLGGPRELLAALKDPPAAVRAAAARALDDYYHAHATRKVPRIVPPVVIRALRRALQDKDTTVRVAAAESLGACGFYAEPALPELGVLIYHRQSALRCAAVLAIGRISKNKEAQRYIRRAQKHRDPSVRAAAHEAKLSKCAR